MPAAILPFMGALSSIGGALASAVPLLAPAATIGSAVIGANASRNMASSNLQAARIASAGRNPTTPGGALIAPQTQIGQASSGSRAPVYSGGQNRYNSAQTLSTAPSLVGTGSGFNAASQSGQPQPDEAGSTGI